MINSPKLPAWKVDVENVIGSEAKRQEAIKDVFKFTNTLRIAQGLPALRLSKRLCLCAQRHSLDQAKFLKTCQHEGSDGTRPSQRVLAVHYNFEVCGENVAHGQTSAKKVMASWINSEAHKANILDPDYKDIGISVTHDPEKDRLYWTQVFGNEMEYRDFNLHCRPSP